jgi:hypothetical protein
VTFGVAVEARPQCLVRGEVLSSGSFKCSRFAQARSSRRTCLA